MAKIGDIVWSENGIDSDSQMHEVVTGNQSVLEELFAGLQSQVDAIAVGLKALPPLPGTKKPSEQATAPTIEKENHVNEQQEIQLEDIRPGASQEQISAAIKKIREVLPGPSITNLQSEIDKINDANTDPEVLEFAEQQRYFEDASAPPSLPDMTGKSEAEKTVVIKKWAEDRDAYFAGLMARPTGQPMTKTEGSALASEILSALRETGHRI